MLQKKSLARDQIDRLDAEIIDPGQGRPVPEPLAHVCELRRRPADQEFDPPVRQVFHPAIEAQLAGLATGFRPEEYPLHPAHHVTM